MELSCFLSEWQEQEQQELEQEEKKGLGSGGENGDFPCTPLERPSLSRGVIYSQPLITAE